MANKGSFFKLIEQEIEKSMQNPRISAFMHNPAEGLEVGNGIFLSKTDPNNPNIESIKKSMNKRIQRMSNPYTYSKRKKFEEKTFGDHPFYGYVEGTLSNKMNSPGYHNYGSYKVHFKPFEDNSVTYTVDDSMKEFGNVFKKIEDAKPKEVKILNMRIPQEFPFYTDFVEAQVHRPVTSKDIESVEIPGDEYDVKRILEDYDLYNKAINELGQHPYPTMDTQNLIAAKKYGYPIVNKDGKCVFNCKE